MLADASVGPPPPEMDTFAGQGQGYQGAISSGQESGAGGTMPPMQAKPTSLPVSEMVHEYYPPLGKEEVSDLKTKQQRGIQGHYNSCYMDSTLFAMFACTDRFDSLLNTHLNEVETPQPKGKSPQKVPRLDEREDVQRQLRDAIVYPLRKYPFSIHFVFFSTFL